MAHDTVAHDTVAHDTVAHDTVAHDTVAHDTGLFAPLIVPLQLITPLLHLVPALVGAQ